MLEYRNMRKTRTKEVGPLDLGREPTKRVRGETSVKKEATGSTFSPRPTHHVREATQSCGHKVTADNPRSLHRETEQQRGAVGLH